jgi:hypothetical protein
MFIAGKLHMCLQLEAHLWNQRQDPTLRQTKVNEDTKAIKQSKPGGMEGDTPQERSISVPSRRAKRAFLSQKNNNKKRLDSLTYEGPSEARPGGSGGFPQEKLDFRLTSRIIGSDIGEIRSG